jgi:cytochrome b subunit of formate dehydrogenase
MRQAPAEGTDATRRGTRRLFIRLNRSERWQHMIFAVCFLLLAVTGFMLRIPEGNLSVLGGYRETVFNIRSIVHRCAGGVMIAVSLYHFFYLIARPSGHRWFIDMRPTFQDAGDMFHAFKYYVGWEKTPPAFDRFSYRHKLEYGALIAGTTIMSITGMLLWTESFWNKFYLDISKLVHGMEAILACLAIMVWHLYEVLLKPHHFPMHAVWLTGVIDEETMKAEYPKHYGKIMQDPELQKIFILGADKLSEGNSVTVKRVQADQLTRIN